MTTNVRCDPPSLFEEPTSLNTNLLPLYVPRELLETPPSEVPPESQYVLERNHSAMYKASYEEQAYWVLALKAARRAGRRAATTQRALGHSQRTRLAANRETRIRYNFGGLEVQMGYELRRQSRSLPVSGHTSTQCRPAWARIKGCGNRTDGRASQPNTSIR